jgi:hypothetical protein
MNYENRKYMIFNVSELPAIDFLQVLETSAETVRKSVDGTKTFVKWEGQEPSCVSSLQTKEGPYTHSEILQILSTPEWTYANPISPFTGP